MKINYIINITVLLSLYVIENVFQYFLKILFFQVLEHLFKFRSILMDVLYEFLYLLSLAEILLISFIFGMVETCRQNQFMESYKTSLRSEKFWKMCLQKHLKKSGFFERDHFCQFWIVCSKVIADSSYKIHQNPKQMWISSLFFQF